MQTKAEAETELLAELIQLPTKYYLQWVALTKKEQSIYVRISRMDCAIIARRLFKGDIDEKIKELAQ